MLQVFFPGWWVDPVSTLVQEREGKQAQIGPALVPGVRWGKGKEGGGGGGGGEGAEGGEMLVVVDGPSQPANEQN